MPAQVVLITGAGSGIGLAAAMLLAQKGFTVALAGRTRETIDTAAAEITRAGGQASAFAADVSIANAATDLVQRVHDAFGRIDVLVNNAGAAPVHSIAEMSPAQWDAVLATNLSAPFYLTRAIWPIMQSQFRAAGAGGVVINISSMASRDPFPGFAAYAAAKSGLNMLTLMTAREGAPASIRAHGIAPAGVNTPMLAKVIGKIDPAKVLAPEDIARIIAAMIEGPLHFTSGETIFVHRDPA